MKFSISIACYCYCILQLPAITNAFTTVVPSSSSSSKIILNANLITFDLDDTIFPVSPVVQDANFALLSHLNEKHEKITQQDLIATTKAIRVELSAQSKVITYTELRKRAIGREIVRHMNMNTGTGTGTDDSDNHDENIRKANKQQIDLAYDIWEENRHRAAEKHLYHDAIAMLQQLRITFPSAKIGAITNGKGNPLMMENTISEYFDFCVSGEDEDVFPERKPSEGIYKVALKRYMDMNVDIDTDRDEEDLCWVHVGDDLANDVGASAKCGAFAIWADLDEESYSQSASGRFTKENSNNGGDKNDSNGKDQDKQPFWSTASKEEIEKRKKLNEESQKFVAARIERLSELPNVITQLTAKTETVA